MYITRKLEGEVAGSEPTLQDSIWAFQAVVQPTEPHCLLQLTTF